MPQLSAFRGPGWITNLSFERHLPVSGGSLNWLHRHSPLKGNIMFNVIRTAIIAAAIAGTTGGAYAATVNNNAKEFGMASNAASADRHVVVKADTKWVNIDDGDTVQFDVDGKSFTWHFDTLRGESAFELSKIAPEGVDAGKVIVYVAANPLYRG
jgi:hypothetical protein